MTTQRTTRAYTRPADATGCACGAKQHRVCSLCGAGELVWVRDGKKPDGTVKWVLSDHLTKADHAASCTARQREETITIDTSKGTVDVEIEPTRPIGDPDPDDLGETDHLDEQRVEEGSPDAYEYTDADFVQIWKGLDTKFETSIERSVSRQVTDRVLPAALEATRETATEVARITAEEIATAIAREEVAKIAPIVVEVRKAGQKAPVYKGQQHKNFAPLLRLLARRKNVFLVGPAGSGKTVSAEHAAKALGLSFHPKSIGPATTEYALMGYEDAVGKYVKALLFEPFTKGGLVLLDEIDSAHPAALTTMNTMLANDYASFPHGVFKKHADFVLIASGNTYGRGADRQYVGRAQLDSATLNRFFILDWDYDGGIEDALLGSRIAAYPESKGILTAWGRYVAAVRDAVSATGVRMIVSTRDLLEGADVIHGDDGFSIEQVANMRFWAASSRDDRAKVEGHMRATGFNFTDITFAGRS